MDVEHPDGSPLPVGEARDLAARAGCTDGEPAAASLGASGSGGFECVADGRWGVRIVSGLTATGVAESVARLDVRRASGTRCADGSLSNPGVVSGPDWVAFVSDHEGAQVVAERLGGSFHPNEVVGPPWGIVNVVCPT